MWQRILMQEDALFRPKNSDYYLSNSATPDLAAEFDLVAEYLHGAIIHSGQPDASPWCRFPGRFAFVADVLEGKLIMPEAFRPCNLAIPALDDALEAYVIKSLASQDTGQALFHVGLVIEGTRFYNHSRHAMNVGFGQHGDTTATSGNVEAVRLTKAFFGDGRVTIRNDYVAHSSRSKLQARQFYRVNLNPEQLYMMSLLAYESTKADLPYRLMGANCHTYLQWLFSAVMPGESNKKRWFFDYFATFMEQNSTALAQQQPLFSSYKYLNLPSTELENITSRLHWNEYQVVKRFMRTSEITQLPTDNLSPLLHVALVKALERSPGHLKRSPELLALRDAYLADPKLGVLAIEASKEPSADDNVPLFNSPHPSAIATRLVSVDGTFRAQFELEIFNTLADQLRAGKPYGFILGNLSIQAFDEGLALDHFLVVQQNKIGDKCCGESLYRMGVRVISGVSVDIVNNPEKLKIADWTLNPALEVTLSKGIGTISSNGLSMQILPELSILTYDDHIDLGVDHRLNWAGDDFAVSISKRIRIDGPDLRRTKPELKLDMAYKLSDRGQFEFSYQRFDDARDITSLGYVYAF